MTLEQREAMLVTMTRLLTSWALLISLFLVPASAPMGVLAQEKSKNTKMAPSMVGIKVEELEALVVEGKIQKPEVFYILGRTETSYLPPVKEASFLDDIIDSVKDNPF